MKGLALTPIEPVFRIDGKVEELLGQPKAMETRRKDDSGDESRRIIDYLMSREGIQSANLQLTSDKQKIADVLRG